MLETFLQTLTGELGLGEVPVKDGTGWFWIPLNPKQRIGCSETPDGILLRAQIAPYPTEKQEEKLTHWMKANFLGGGTGEALLGLDPEGKFLTLSQPLQYDINYTLFQEALEQFANYLDYWQGA